MANNELTKKMIAQAFKVLLAHKPFDHITINDISKACSISRNTFYYHFQDKHDLIEWIFYNDIVSLIENKTSLEDWDEGLLELCIVMQKNRLFYINALKIQGQNSFSECLMVFFQKYMLSFLQSLCINQPLTKTEIIRIARFYAYGMTGTVMDWAKNGMIEEPAATVRMLKKWMSGEIMHLILK